MIPAVGLRTRLTLLVALVFAAAVSFTSIVVLNAVEDELIEDTRASAESVLTSYLETINGGTATIGVVDSASTTRFFYREADGAELTEQAYFEMILAGLDAEVQGLMVEGPYGPFGQESLAISEPLVRVEGVGPIAVDPETGRVLDTAGATMVFTAGPQPLGDPRAVDLGADVVAVSQTLAFADGMTFEVGVSSPLQPVTDSLDTIRGLLLMAVPALIAAVAGITWLATGRALRPVHAISSQARAISADNIDQRLAVPEATDEIRELATTMNDLLGRLEASQLRQHQLIADASHELRSPVAASRTQLEVATANPDNTDWATTGAIVLAEQERLTRLIDDLLALSRIDETNKPAPTDVDLDDLIATEADRPYPTKIRTSIPAPVRIYGEPGLLTRAVRNLIDNASRHAESEVLVSLSSRAGTAVIDVHDDGPGVPVEQRDRIFDRFTRIDEARDRREGGAGLGLAIVREVAHRHNGTVSVTASELGGAHFAVVIPIGVSGRPE